MARTLTALAATLALAGCSGDGRFVTDAAEVGFDRRAVLAHLADHLLIPTYDRFATDTVGLVTAIDARCAALGGAGDPVATEVAAQAAWATAIDGWESADAVLVGPAVAADATLRNRIYAWPNVGPCSIDNDVLVRWNTPASYDVTTRFDNARSLAAVEYLLFFTATSHSCPLAPNGWDALGADLPKARCALAASIARDVATQAAALATAWRPGGGGYRDQLALAGTAGSSIVSEREALNMVSDGLFYVDEIVKDMKLGEASGLTMNACGTVDAPCLREVEHRFADRSSFAIRINLRALRAAFTGTAAVDGPGFDDYLRAVGATELADRMTGSLDAAIVAADALPDGFIAALTADRARIVAVHAATKAFTDDLKSQFLTVLGLDIPDDVAGDVD